MGLTCYELQAKYRKRKRDQQDDRNIRIILGIWGGAAIVGVVIDLVRALW